MGAETKIQWCHHTFNPWVGCAKVHAGCTHCYAEKSPAAKLRMGGSIEWGEVWQGGDRVVVADSTWKQPLRWAQESARAGERRRVFCASLADVLEVPEMPPFERLTTALRDTVHHVRQQQEGARRRLWDVIRQTAELQPSVGSDQVVRWVPHDDPRNAWSRAPGLDWLLLTKRPENWRLVPEDVRPLVWLGTSVSDQKTADEWVPRLLEAQGFRLRFLSVEPLLGPADLKRWMPWVFRKGVTKPFALPAEGGTRGVEWVIVGGESGPGARPCAVEWVSDVVRQCREAGVPCFVKQLGAVPVMSEVVWRARRPTLLLNAKNARRAPDGTVPLYLSHAKGGSFLAEWPEDLRVRELPAGGAR